MRVTVSNVLSLGVVVLIASAAGAQTVTIDAALATPETGFFELTGQSAFITTQTGSLSTGGQLDGLTSPGGLIVYNEAFPVDDINDYLSFGYFGLIRTLDDQDELIDLSLVVALQSGVGIGQTIGSVFAGLDESVLVSALQAFDSPEFFELLSAAGSSPDALGTIGLPTMGRPGESLTLVAFTGGKDGDLGVAVGTMSVTAVPAPASAALLSVLGVASLRRRRRCA